MDISIRTQQLNSLFSYDKKTDLTDSHLEIIPFRFTQTIGASEINEFQKELTGTDFCPVTDNHIQENKTFTYTVFAPSGKEKRDRVSIFRNPAPFFFSGRKAYCSSATFFSAFAS